MLWCGAYVLLSCSRGDSSAAKPLARLPDPVRPAALLAEAALPSIEEAWPTFKTLLGPSGQLLPGSPQLALGALLGLDALTSTTLDLRDPATLAIVGESEQKPELVLGVGLDNGAEFVARLTTGAAATHTAQVQPAFVLLVPRAVGAQRSFAVAGKTLLWGQRPALQRVADYLARSPFRFAKQSGPLRFEIASSTFGRWFAPALKQRWGELRTNLAAGAQALTRARGRPADFADPEALLLGLDAAVVSLAERLAEVSGATGELSLGAERVRLSLRLRAAPEASLSRWTASLPRGGPELLLELPAAVSCAVSFRSSPPSDQTDTAPWLRQLFGERLRAEDEAALGRTRDALLGGLGPVWAVGVLPEGRLLARAEVRDRALGQRGLREGVGWLRQKPLLSPLTDWLGTPVLREQRPKSSGVSFEQFEFTFLKPPRPNRKWTLAWAVEPQRLLLAAAANGAPPIEEGLGAVRDQRALGSDARIADWLASVPSPTALAYADLSALGLVREPKALLLAALRVESQAPELVLVASAPTLRAALSQAMQ